MDQRFRGIADLGQGGFDLTKGHRALRAHQRRPEDRRQNNNRQGPTEANCPTYLNKKCYFYQRYSDKR